MPQLPHSVELHDSLLSAVRRLGRDLVLELRPAYVHRDGKGWKQDVDLHFPEAADSTAEIGTPVRICDGALKTEGGPYHNLLMLPLAVTGSVVLCLELQDGEELRFRAGGASAQLMGTPVFVENFD